MKKSLIVWSLTCVALPLAAQSTCETRVDSHPEATTLQRVAYCLTPEATPVVENKTELIYYGVSSAEPTEKTVSSSKNKNPYFYQEKVSVSQDYVGTERFPTFANDTISEQELAALQLQQTQTVRGQNKPNRKKSAVNEQPTRETQKGLFYRQQKPARYQRAQSPLLQEPELVPAAVVAAQPAADTPVADTLPEEESIPSTQDLSYGVAPMVGDYEALPQTNPYTLED